jgi:hypothetical protein
MMQFGMCVGADIHLKINAVWLAAQTVDRIFNRKV